MPQMSNNDNNKYRVLSCLYHNINTSRQISITPQAVAKLLDMTDVIVMKHFRQLKKQGYLTSDGKRSGPYYLTETGMNLAKHLEKDIST